MNPLFSPIKLKNLTLNNRIVVPPMDQYSAEDGQPVNWHAMHYGNLAVSGAGLVIVEATAVEPAGRISPQDLGLWNSAQEAAHKGMLDTIRSYSSTPMGIQIGHAGRKGSTGRPWEGGKPCPPTAQAGKFARLLPCPTARATKPPQRSQPQTLPGLQNPLSLRPKGLYAPDTTS